MCSSKFYRRVQQIVSKPVEHLGFRFYQKVKISLSEEFKRLKNNVVTLQISKLK